MMNKTSTAEAPKLTRWLNPPQPAGPMARFRLTLREGETYILSPGAREVCILSGAACILDDGREAILFHGEQGVFTAGQGESVISVSGDAPLVFEMAIDAASDEARCMKRQFYERMAARQQRIEAEDWSDAR